jgi:hypothetical protein
VTLRNYESLGKYVPHFLHIPVLALWFSYHSVEQTMHTIQLPQCRANSAHNSVTTV